MTGEKDDQGQSGIIEDTGTTTEKEKRLTLEAEKLIRRFMIKWVSLPAIFLAVISFALGFFIERVAFQTASNQAFQSAQSEVMKLIEQVMEAKHKADAAAGAIHTSAKEISKTEGHAKKFDNELSSLRSKLASTVAFQASDPQIKKIAEVLARDPRITRVLNDLDNSIRVRLKKADEEIDKIKSTYKIECLEWAAGQEERGRGRVFTFPFAVKHAWVELSQYTDEAGTVSIKTIDGKTVIAVAWTRAKTSQERAMEREMLRPRTLIQLKYRVWATSF